VLDRVDQYQVMDKVLTAHCSPEPILCSSAVRALNELKKTPGARPERLVPESYGIEEMTT
jgi:hypothetical protein